jgi:hypothetical protein
MREAGMRERKASLLIVCGVSADAFFAKGASLDALLRILKFLPLPERWAQHRDAAPAPVWRSSFAGQERHAHA